MCGICGYITKRDVRDSVLSTMIETLRHRGPDDSGEERLHFGDAWIGLGHRRLSILDTTKAGHQPMFVSDGKVGIVYNGEVYNFRELRDELHADGVLFHSDCDTEVILNAYLKEGIRCVERLNGMFAFVLVDLREGGDIFFVRDRIGQKPLYIYEDGKDIVFASELKAIMKFPGFHAEIRTDLMARYLYHGYFGGEDTVFRNVHRVLPGHIVHLHLGGSSQLKDSVYWNISDFWNESYTSRALEKQDYQVCKQELKQLLLNSVRRRLVSDVPVGLFLSGGIDSSLISAMAQACSSKPIKTYCIGFSEVDYDEAPYAEAIAHHLGTNHHTMCVDDSSCAEMLDDMCWYFDEPFADASQIPTMLVSKFARQDVTVVLSGDGGDEFFCGYGHYDRAYWYDKYSLPIRIFPRFRMLIAPLTQCGMMPYRGRKALSILSQPLSIVQNVSLLEQEEMERCLLGEQQNIGVQEPTINGGTYQERRMLLDMTNYLPDDILVKVDRASMRFSLECRSPFLDPSVVRFALRLPTNFKYDFKSGRKKLILQDILSEYLPRQMFERKKHGFGIPIWKYIEKKEFVRKIVDPVFIKRQGIFRYEGIVQMYRRFALREARFVSYFWHYYVFQMWHEHFLGRHNGGY